ncbi:MAG: LamG domain-containing protein [Kiritimatiellia bacterium]
MNGMNPLENSNTEGAAMNADGDFMARWDSEEAYAIATFKLLDGTVREYAIAGNYGKYFEITDEKTGAATLTEDAKTNQFVAISVFRYGNATNGVCVPRFRGGAVKNTVESFGEATEAKPLDALVWELGEATNDGVVVTLKLNQKIALIHDQVNAQFGFDPRTGWNNKDGFVADRWKTSTKGSENEGDSGKAVNTVKYTALDEYLLLKYRYETNKEMPDGLKLVNYRGSAAPYSVEADELLWNASPNRRCGEVFLYGTTAPNLPFETPDWVAQTTTMGDATFASDLHGADTDMDGVPDGWELYVKHNPNWAAEDDTKDQDDDNLNLVREYAGTDSCNAYADCETVITNHPGLATGWYNKFFPTNPEDKDTDGDGIADDQEGATWKASVVWGNGASGGDDSLTTEHTFSFIYGSNEGRPVADDGSVCIRGGGLNPCSVDTDGDCLPDPWERQFAGPVFGPNGMPDGSLTFSAGSLQLIRRADGLASGAAAVDYYITAGMDGTFKKDAWTDPSYTDPATGTVRDFDFDHDGLQNYQEYLVQALRHLRYDDSSTPLMGQWMPSGGPASLQYFGFIPMNIMDGETFYARVKKAGYPATGAWNFRDLGYFAPPPHAWDKVALNTSTKDRLAYDEMGFRVMLRPNAIAGGKQATGYCSTDPRNWDSDGDGMDDYYELFHGLNPLLGEVAGGTISGDVIALAYGGQVANWYNAWTGWPMMAPEDPVYDAMRFPWMMGAPGCDADGDGLNNYEEALLANITSPQPSHTDPTPLWMTDSSSLNNASFVSQYYKMDCDALLPDFIAYPWTANDPDGFLFAFEENEGYDTDHDGISDSEEKKLTTTALSDPLNFTDPDRRQALWFPGDKSAAVSYACTPGNSSDVAFDSLRQFTVEVWVNPEDVARDQVVLERAVGYFANTLSNNVSQIRANFRVGIMADGRLYGLFDTSDAVETGAEGSSAKVMGAKIEEGAWTHVALTFNGTKLALFMNGRKVGELQTTLVPANGIVGVTQQPVPGGDAFPSGSGYTFYTRSALVLGASAVNADAVVLSTNTKWESYASFFKGFVDEVRVWDGAKTETEVLDGYKTRLSVSDAKTLRQAVYEAWADGATRNDNDTNGTLPVELVFHYSFSTLPGAVDAADVMWEPSGFTMNVLDNVRVGGEEIPGDLYCGWWKSLPVHSTVYANYRWVPWVPNMVAHLPPMDGSAVDSQYWAERVAGVCSAGEATGKEAFLFPNTMTPYAFYHNNGGNDLKYYNNRLVSLSKVSSGFDDVYSLFSFEKRTASLGSTDLLPLGGAFAKRMSALWDGEGASDVWTYTGDDLDGNGLPDWWEALYSTGDALTLETLVEWHGQWITAREAYLRDLAAGLQPDGTVDADYKATADRDHDGLPDWWENLYGIADESGEDDHDGDGLSNFAEYLIAECFSNYGFPRVKPDQARTFISDGQLVTDYFLTKGQLYLGEMFADHDFCEDVWEDLYATRIDATTERLFASRYIHDMWDDSDEDGWSNFAECRAGTDPTRAHTVSYVSDDFPEFPVSTVRAAIRYNGSKATTSGNLVLRSYSSASVKGKPDATWVLSIGGSKTQDGSSSSSSSSGAEVGVSYERLLGVNPGTTLSLNLGSGTVVPGTVRIYFRDLTALKVEQNGSGVWLDAASTSWCQGLRDIYTGLETKTADLSEGTNGRTVGSVNYETGDLTIDFSKLNPYLYSGDSVYTWYNPGVSNAYERLDISRSFVRVEWRGQVAASENIWNANLAKADVGHLREGVNTFEAFLDLNGDGLWTPGEPYGVASDVDVGWSSAVFALELTDVAPQMFRVDMQLAVQSNDFEAQKSLNDRGAANSIGVGSNRPVLDEAIGQNMPDGTETETRIRLVRTAVSDIGAKKSGTSTTYAHGVALDVTRDFVVNPYFTECDLVKTGALDLDWGRLGSVATSLGVDFQNITSAVYRVVLGDGTVSPTQPTNNNCLATAFVNVFERGMSGYQTRCEPVSPKGIVTSARPTFRWTHDNALGKAYPAFRLRVRKGTSIVYDSGNQRAPARDINGVYSWTAPLYVDMVVTNGVVFANTNNYTWSVSMLDAKFTTPNANETEQEFRMEVPAKLGSLSDYGELTAKVHYFGPATTSNTARRGLVRVQAFTSPDFAGLPAGEATISGMEGLGDVNGEGCVAVIRGLPVGTYYVRAYVDSDGDATFSKWESWGYSCHVGDSDAKGYTFTPKAYVVAKGVATPEAEVFIEDMDVDNDGLPDAWEYDRYGTLDQRSAPNGGTFFTKVNPDLATTVAAYLNLADGGLRIGTGYAAMTLMNALVSDDSFSLSDFSFLLSGQPQPAVSETLVVKIDSFSLENGMAASVTTTVTGAGNELVIPVSEAKVGVYLVASDALDFSNVKSTRVKGLTIRANAQTTATVSAEEVKRAIEASGLDATSFFKIKLVRE